MKHPLAHATGRSTLRTVFATGAIATTAFAAAAWHPAPAAPVVARPAVETSAASRQIDATLFVSPYQDRLRADGGLSLDGLRLRVLDGMDGMGGTRVVAPGDRICLDVFDAARGFSPALIRFDDMKALELAAQLDEASGGPLAAAFERASNARGMTVMFGTQPYARNAFGAIELSDDVTFFVQGAYHGLDDQQRPFIDDRVTLAVADDARGFWPLTLLLDRDIVRALTTELRDAVRRRSA